MPEVIDQSSNPRRVRAEHLRDLIGTSVTRPRLSWWLPEHARRQTAYRVATSSWSSDWIESDQQHLVAVHAPIPRSGRRDELRVQVRTDLGESDWSDAVIWETGLLDDADWQARWIGPVEPEIAEAGQRPVYELTTSFDLPPIVGARAHVTAHGVYELAVNGFRAGDIELAPGFTAYATNLYVQTYDIGDLLRPGANTVSIRLSDGWFRGRLGLEREPDGFGRRTAVLCQLVVEVAGGDRIVLGSGPEWLCRPLPETADLMDGHSIDRLAADAPRVPAELRDVPTPPALRASEAPPVRRIEELRPVSVQRVANGHQVVDLGQNISGWSRLSRLGAAGSRVTLTHGEALAADGSVTMDHLRGFRVATLEPLGAGQVDTVVSDGDAAAAFESRHSTKGFRYIEIAGHSDDLVPADVTGIVVHTDLEHTGSFDSSDDRLNRLHDAAVWSLRSNVCDIPTDCPQRERSGFTGDWQIYAPTAAFLYDVAAFTRKWLRDLAADQWADGRVPTVTPDPGAGGPTGTLVDAFVGSAGWGDAAVLVPWAMWRAYGDRRFLEEQYESMVGWVDFGARRAAESRHPARAAQRPVALPHEQYLWDAGFHFGEWLEPGEIPRPDPAADHGAVATAYLHRSAGTLATIAAMLGRTADAERYAAIAEGARAAWQAEYLSPDSTLSPDTQATYVRALAFGLVPADQRSAVAERLAALVRAAGGHLGTGFLSTADLLPVLADCGHLDLAYELLLATGYPSWMQMLDSGATTIWENWDGIAADGTPKSSLNHYSKGAVISFLHTVVCGIRMRDDGDPESVGYRRFVVAPRPGGGLTRAAATHDSPYGTIRSAWELTGNTYRLEVTVPAGSAATVLLPDGRSHEVECGEFRYSWNAVAEPTPSDFG